MATEAGNSSSSSSGTKRITPPKLCEDVPYRSWKNKLMWKLVCNVDVKEQGIIVLSQLLIVGNKKA